MKKPRGGKRIGAGRPKIAAKDRAVTVTVTLPAIKAAVAQSLGGSTAKTPNLKAIRRGILVALDQQIAFAH